MMGTFSYCQVPGWGLLNSSDQGCHLVLEAAKDLVTSQLPVA